MLCGEWGGVPWWEIVIIDEGGVWNVEKAHIP